jgi:hypothetical protein
MPNIDTMLKYSRKQFNQRKMKPVEKHSSQTFKIIEEYEMTDREKIIEMAKKCGILKRLTPLGTDEVWGNVSNLEAFYRAAQAEAFEQAAAGV